MDKMCVHSQGFILCIQHDNKVAYSVSIFVSLPNASIVPLNLLSPISLRARSPQVSRQAIDVLNSAFSIEVETYFAALYSWNDKHARLTHKVCILVSFSSVCTLPVNWLLLISLTLWFYWVMELHIYDSRETIRHARRTNFAGWLAWQTLAHCRWTCSCWVS